MNKPEVASATMRSWNILVEATIQGAKIQGTITCHSSSENSAKRLACLTFINQLRRAGIWASADEVDESYEVESAGPKDKKTGKSTVKVEIKHKKVTKYIAPYWNHVKAIEIIASNSRDFTFSIEELEEAALEAKGMAKTKRHKRRTSGDVALAKRAANKQKVAAKQEALDKKKKKAVTNKQNKIDLLRAVEKYFTAGTAKVIKDAVKDLSQTYQRIRYALFQIKDNGYNGAKYNLIETKIDGNKAFQLKKAK